MKVKVHVFLLILSILCLLASAFVAWVEHSLAYALLAGVCVLILVYFTIQLTHDKKKLH